MTVHVDSLIDYGSMAKAEARLYGTRWCHLWSDRDDEDVELNAFAKRIGLRRGWLKTDHEDFHHYDVVESRRVRAVSAGAVETELLDYLRERRGHDAHDTAG